MQTIYKYDITPDDRIKISMPRGAKILSIQMQHNNPKIWALVETDNAMVERQFSVYGTGHRIQSDIENMNYIGTFQVYSGELVFHLFEVTEK